MLTQCDVIKDWARRYLHKVTSSKLSATLFATASQRRFNRCQFDNFVEFITKTEEFVVFMQVYNKNIITLVT